MDTSVFRVLKNLIYILNTSWDAMKKESFVSSSVYQGVLLSKSS